MNADGVVQSDGREAHELRRSMHPPAPLARRHVTVSEFEEWLAEGGEGLPPKFEASDVEAAFVNFLSCTWGGTVRCAWRGSARADPCMHDRALTESDDHSIVSSRLIAIIQSLARGAATEY